MVSSERSHLLLLAFAIFFAVVHGPVHRHPTPMTGAGFPEAFSLDAAGHSSDHGNQDPGREAHDSPAALEESSPAPLLAELPSGVLDLNAARDGRRVGFGDTPPPRVA